MAHGMSARMGELLSEKVPFVHATVVRAQAPTSARPGDDAIVLGNGTIEGFVGGQCAEESVRTAALEVLAQGEALLLRVLPEGDVSFPDTARRARSRQPLPFRRGSRDLPRASPAGTADLRGGGDLHRRCTG